MANARSTLSGKLFHSVLDSIFMFSGLVTGAPRTAGPAGPGLEWSATGNVVGGLVLVTGIRFLRVQHRILEQRQQG